MPGTKQGGKLAAKTNKDRHGPDFYKRIGAKGGAVGNTGGFASNLVDENGLTGPQRASIAGAKGGAKSRRGKAKKNVKND